MSACYRMSFHRLLRRPRTFRIFSASSVRRQARRLYAYDAYTRVRFFHGAGDSGDQAASADGGNDGLNVRNLLKNFEAHVVRVGKIVAVSPDMEKMARCEPEVRRRD